MPEPIILPARHAKAPARPPCQSRSSCPQTPPPHCERASAVVALLNAPACGIGTRGFWAWRSWHRRLVGYGLCQNPYPTGDFCQLCQAALTASCAGAPHLHTLAALRADGPSQHFKPRSLALHASASRAAQCKRFGAVRHAGSAAEKPSRRGLTLHPNPWRLQGPAISARMSRIFRDSLLESVGRPGQQARWPGLSRAGYTGAGVWYTPKTQDLCSCRAGRDIECHRSHKAKRSKRKTGSPPKWSPDNSFKNPAPAPLLRKSSLSWASRARS